MLLSTLGRNCLPDERPADALLDLGLMPERDFALELALRSGRPFMGLRDFTPDPELFVYLPFEVALAERVCPLGLEGDVFAIAGAFLDPDLSSVEQSYPHLTPELVAIAPRGELLSAVARARGTSA